MRVISLNLNGIRSAERKGFTNWLVRQKADVVCLQETRVQDGHLTPRMRGPGRFEGLFLHAQKPGYSGVGLYGTRKPDRILHGVGWKEADAEARLLQADFGRLSIVSLYMPSGSHSEERQAFKYRFMDRLAAWLARKREDGREYLVCGDWNIAHTKKDIKNWRGNQKNSGFLPEERAWMNRLFGEWGWRDAYRRIEPETEGEGYTWWSNRGNAWANNVGWRIDYQVATPGIAAAARAAVVYKRKRFSDHAPLIVDYDYEA